MLALAIAAALNLASLDVEQKAALSVMIRAKIAKACAARGDILGWGRAVMPEKFPLPFCPGLHEFITSSRLHPLVALKAPRGHSKTTIGCTLVPLYSGLEEPKLYDFYLNIQANDPKALSVNRAIKDEIENNLVLQEAYGDMTSGRWTDAEFVLSNGVVYKALGAGVSLRGVQYNNRRPSCIIVDDLYDEEDINNHESTIKRNDWLKGTLFKAIAKGRPTSFRVGGTAINASDILTDMEKWPGCLAKTFQAINDDGTPLWPQLNTKEELDIERERLGSTIFNREMMNICRDDSEAIIKSAWLNGWEYDPKRVWAKGFTKQFFLVAVKLGVDPSIGAKLIADKTGVALVILTGSTEGSRKDYWIEGLWNELLSQDQRIKLLERIQAQQPPGLKITQAPIEGIAGFKDFVSEVKRRTSLPVKEISWVKDKISNLESKSGHFEGGRVHLSKDIPKPLRDELFNQLTTNVPRHDDMRDAVLLCLEDPTSSWRSWV